MYESARQPLIARYAFLQRLLLHAGGALLVRSLSLGIGMMFTPVLHRVLHILHLDETAE